MKKSMLLGLMAVVIAGLAVTAQTVSAYRGDPAVKGPNYTQERHEAMEKAFSNQDYNAWKKLMAGRGRVTQAVNAGNFSKFVQIHDLIEKGKIDEANKMRAELGLGLHNRAGMGQGMGYGRMSR